MRYKLSPLLPALLLLGTQATGQEPPAPPDPDGPDSEPRGVFMWVEVTPDAFVSEFVTIRLLVRNRRESEAFVLENIDIEDRFLDGFELMGITPEPTDTDHSSGSLTLTYHLEVRAQGKEVLVIYLRAKKHGIFSGDFNVWSNGLTECATRRLQTEVEGN